MAQKNPRSIDRHVSGFLVRLPEPYRKALQELKRKTDRPFSAMVRRALDAYLKENGVRLHPVST